MINRYIKFGTILAVIAASAIISLLVSTNMYYSEANVSQDESFMVSITNDYRHSHGLSTLTTSNKLMLSSQIKADMLCKTGVWSHTPNGEPFYSTVNSASYDYTNIGENLVKGTDDMKIAINALISSPPHLKNILGDYKEIGVGTSDCNGRHYTVIHYGTR